MSALTPVSAALPLHPPSFCTLWDFSLFRALLWDMWDIWGWGCSTLTARNSELPRYQLATYNVQLPSNFPQVTWAYCADSIESCEKLEANNHCDHNAGVIAKSTHLDFQIDQVKKVQRRATLPPRRESSIEVPRLGVAACGTKSSYLLCSARSTTPAPYMVTVEHEPIPTAHMDSTPR